MECLEGGQHVDAVPKASSFSAGLRSRAAGDRKGVAAFGRVKKIALGQEERDLVAKGHMNGGVKVSQAALVTAEAYDSFLFFIIIRALAYASRARNTLSFNNGSRPAVPCA